MSAVARRVTALAALASAALLCSLAFAHSAQAVVICSERYAITAGSSSFQLPYCTNRSLSAPDAGVRRLVVVVHGTGRNAADYQSYMTTAAADAGASDALVIAPQFLTSSDGPSTGVLRWTSEGWKQGDQSTTTPSVSSFAVVDQMVTKIVGSGDFPNLREVVVAGHSAGGQFTERYAATNRIDGTIGLPIRYVVANPSSYLYLTNERPVAGSTTQFAVPGAAGCPGYDDYKYGLHGLNAYLSATGADGIRAQFAARHVTYLLGGADTDPANSSLDISCEGEMQGPYRLARGQAFYNDLGRVYGPSVYATQTETIVPGVAHDGLAMFCSPEGQAVLFAPLAALDPAPVPDPAPAPAPAPVPPPVVPAAAAGPPAPAQGAPPAPSATAPVVGAAPAVAAAASARPAPAVVAKPAAHHRKKARAHHRHEPAKKAKRHRKARRRAHARGGTRTHTP